eukprot:TRINITY_DN25831_c0_g1_i1.p1 TRINITY_DN25831_c0_g1~~TRINITY_DN25831_c0_g1_i1.p1  ORF type:complete len:482 (-),score=59.82 TRINITY_DN25831_c0_g1_i1:176-1621(-)
MADCSRGFSQTWGNGCSGAGAMMLVPPSTPGHHNPPSPRASWPRCSFGAATLANIGKGSPENQDTYVTSSNPTGSKCFVGVFDGHGEKGRRISEFSRNMLTKSLFSHKDLQTDPRSALEGAFFETQGQIERDYSAEASYSGTTAVTAYQHRNTLWVANVGDSRCVLGCSVDGSGRDPESLKAVDMSSDHKPSRPDERRRITEQGGVVQQSAVPVQTNGGGLRLVRMGPERVMDKGGFGGLAVSRSLGDLSLRPYVSSLPEVVERKLSARDKVLILGSDGVWDRLTSQEAVNIAGKIGDPVQAARMIASVARKRWQAETQGLLADDITAVVVNLEHDSSCGSSPHSQLQLEGRVPSRGSSASRVNVKERSISTPPNSMRRKTTMAHPATEFDMTAMQTTVHTRRRPSAAATLKGESSEAQSPGGHRPVTGGTEAAQGGFNRHERLRRHKTTNHVGLEPLRGRATPVTDRNLPNHLMPAAGRR